ncbi:signal peptidase I [Culicoidibacter larvae]|uniref:Signal peptidase I n=1 Tax=Culicoidibacter larvae TaxID=2579976 RepID=A0A5R8Q9M9_9FIRM|nr:signal peptidase I [Culicoidibacter larvae]TLG72557.1 signal peptidase I [Culicoidibacter larvae]
MEKKPSLAKRIAVSAAKLFGWLCIIFSITLLLNAFVFSVAMVEGISMEPTLVDGERLILDRISYRFTNPSRFDIVVIDPDSDRIPEGELIIKRVIGLPGEKVAFRGNQLYVDNELVAEDFIVDPVNQYTNDFTVAQIPGNGGNSIIPEGYYLVLGDNRTHSVDSRQIGLVPKEQILGKAAFSIWPIDKIQFLTVKPEDINEL